MHTRNPGKMTLIAAALLVMSGCQQRFFEAVKKNQTSQVKWMLIFQPSLANAKDQNNSYPLHLAVRQGSPDMVKLLVAKGADVNGQAGAVGYPPLHWAFSQGNLEIFNYLLDHGADINLKDKENQDDALHHAAEWGSTEMVEVLVKRGADLKGLNGLSRTPLLNAVAGGRAETVEWLLSQPDCDVNAKGAKGETALHLAAWLTQTEIAKILLRKGADVNARDNKGDTPLHNAAGYVHADTSEAARYPLAKLLLEQGAEVNARNNKDQTPLAAAREEENDKIAQLLRSYGGEE